MCTMKKVHVLCEVGGTLGVRKEADVLGVLGPYRTVGFDRRNPDELYVTALISKPLKSTATTKVKKDKSAHTLRVGYQACRPR
jgi:hypothetical protein